MKNLLLTTSLVLAVAVFVLQLPVVQNAKSIQALSFAALPTMSAMGAKYGVIVDKVVKNIHAKIPQAKITHADVLTIMCMEAAGLVGKSGITSGAGARGVTQVMPGTLRQYASTHQGGFYLPYRPDLLGRDPRYSIEAGALIYNSHLMIYNGDRVKAAKAYNGGRGVVNKPVDRCRPQGSSFNRGYIPCQTRDYAYRKLPYCFNNIKRGISPVRNNVWRAMVAKVSELTSGTMGLGVNIQGAASDIPALHWPVQSMFGQSRGGLFNFSRFFGGGQTGAQGAGASRQSFVPNRQAVAQNNGVNQYQYKAPGYKSNTDASNNYTAMRSKLICTRDGEVITINWACPQGSTGSKGYGAGFNTHNANIGRVKIKQASPANYELACINNYSTINKVSCKVGKYDAGVGTTPVDKLPGNTVITLDYSNKSHVLSWASLGASKCELSLVGKSHSALAGKVRLTERFAESVKGKYAKLVCDTKAGPAVKYVKIE